MKDGPFGPAELAREAGVSTDTLRHYERKGLLVSARLPNGYRSYTAEALGRVRLVQHALSAGFTIEELSRILKERDRGGAPCREVRKLARAKLDQVERQIKGLLSLRDEMRGLLKVWDQQLAHTPNGKPAHLLDILTETPTKGGETSAHVGRYGLPDRRRKTR